MKQLFGTDGVRGVANVYPMTPRSPCSSAGPSPSSSRTACAGNTIVIGKDTRLSGYMLENALAAGICSMGVNVQLVGPLPTPGIAFITTSMRADAGVVISASKPFQDNGIKIFSADGFKLPDEVEADIEDLIFSQKMAALRPVAEEVGKASRIDDAAGRYIVALKNTFPKITCSTTSTSCSTAPTAPPTRSPPHVFAELGARVTCIGCEPDGTNINDGCGALHPEVMAAQVQQLGVDIGTG